MDNKHFEIIYKRYFQVLYNFSLHIVGKAEVAEDIVQDVFLSLWSNRNEVDYSVSTKPYLYTLTYRKSLDHLKRSESKNIPISSHIHPLDEFYYSIFMQDEDIYVNEMSSIIKHTIDSLPDKCKEVFRLSREKGMKNKEIAEKLNISVKAVEKQITKALADLRNQLREKGYLSLIYFILSMCIVNCL